MIYAKYYKKAILEFIFPNYKKCKKCKYAFCLISVTILKSYVYTHPEIYTYNSTSNICYCFISNIVRFNEYILISHCFQKWFSSTNTLFFFWFIVGIRYKDPKVYDNTLYLYCLYFRLLKSFKNVMKCNPFFVNNLTSGKEWFNFFFSQILYICLNIFLTKRHTYMATMNKY